MFVWMNLMTLELNDSYRHIRKALKYLGSYYFLQTCICHKIPRSTCKFLLFYESCPSYHFADGNVSTKTIFRCKTHEQNRNHFKLANGQALEGFFWLCVTLVNTYPNGECQRHFPFTFTVLFNRINVDHSERETLSFSYIHSCLWYNINMALNFLPLSHSFYIRVWCSHLENFLSLISFWYYSMPKAYKSLIWYILVSNKNVC